MGEYCWATIGVRGNRSCPELEEYVHCRNCPVHAAAGEALLEAPATDADIARWTTLVAAPLHRTDASARAGIIFRLGGEWLAISMAVVSEVLATAKIHTIPHRRLDVVFGIVNVRGELVPCASLAQILGSRAPADAPASATYRRFLVLQLGEARFACPVDDVHGIHRFEEHDIRPLPSTIEKAAARFSRGVLAWNEHAVGLLDEETLGQMLSRSVP